MDRERAVERDEAFRSSQIQYARWLENLRENPIHLRRGQILNDCGLDLARIAGIMNTCAAMCLARFARSRIAISRWYHLRAAGDLATGTSACADPAPGWLALLRRGPKSCLLSCCLVVLTATLPA